MCLYPVNIFTRPKEGSGSYVTVSCGKCLECLSRRSNEWSFRIMLEASQYESNCFITLTYNDENLPLNGSVSRREVQLFMKSLRQALSPLKVRFFACGEYGKKLSRPHYHLIIFNWFPDDSYPLKVDKRGQQLYRSPFLETVWKKGFSSVGKLTLDSARYCAKYMSKWQFVRGFKTDNMQPPFIQMSNRPGIGYNSVYRSDMVSDKVYFDGRSVSIPRYFLKVMESDGIFLDDLKERRLITGQIVSRSIDLEAKRKFYFDKFLKPFV